jgi:hypothetical protein
MRAQEFLPEYRPDVATTRVRRLEAGLDMLPYGDPVLDRIARIIEARVVEIQTERGKRVA